MTKWNKPQDPISTIDRLERAARRTAINTYNDGDGPPLPPTVAVTMHIREYLNRPTYSAVVTWGLVSPNTCRADVDKWIVQFRATDDVGNPVQHQSGGPDIKYEKTVDNKQDSDPHAGFVHLPRPKMWYWQARVAIKDKAHHLGAFSAWTTPSLPFADAGPKPPTPTGVALTYDTIEKTRWDRVRAIVTWDEISNWDIPGTPSATVTNATAAASIATFTIAVDLNLVPGNQIQVKGVTPTAYNGTWKVLTVAGGGTVITANIGATPANLSSTGTMTDVKDKESDVDRYMVQMRNTNSSGTVTNGTPRKQTIQAHDADADTTQAVAFSKHIKKTDYFQCRVRSIDRYNRKGDWSAWTPATPTHPSDNTAPPVPTSVTAEGLFDRVTIDWGHPTDAADSELVNVDVAYYQIQLATDAGFSNITRFDRMQHKTRRIFDTRAYKTRYWLRVRSVDASENKSSWVSAGPVRPQKIQGARVVVAGHPTATQMDYSNDAGLDLAGGLTNHAYLVSTTADAYASMNGEETYGTLSGAITLSPTDKRAKAGFAFNGVNNNNHLIAWLEKTATQDRVVIAKKDTGTVTVLASATSFGLHLAQTYIMDVDLTSTHGTIKVSIDGVLAVTYAMTAGEKSKYQGGTGINVGLYCDRGAAVDDGLSRFEELHFIGETAGLETGDDTFDRDASTTALGQADSGDTWVANAGTWGIEAVDAQFAVYGVATVLPVYYMEDLTARTSESIPSASGGSFHPMGTGGSGNGPLEIWFDRPTRIIGWSCANFENESATVAYNARHYILMQDIPTLTVTSGRQVNNFMTAADSTNNRTRLLVVMRSMFVNASPSNVLGYRFWWGYNQDDASGRQATIRNQKMILLCSYAPDYDPSAVSTVRNPTWTKNGTNRIAYQQTGN